MKIILGLFIILTVFFLWKKSLKKKTENTKSFFRKGVFPYQWAFTLLVPLRNIFLSPKTLVKRLQIKKHYKILEVGPGPGYFSPTILKAIPKGKLVLIDIQEEMLTMARKRIEKSGFKNVEYHLSNGKTFPFKDADFDIIFLVTVIGEIENKESYIHEFFRILREGGIVSVSEQWGDSDKMTQTEVINLFEAQGFSLDARYGGNANFTLNFKKPLTIS